MHRLASICVGLIALLSVAHGADAPVPAAWPADRYSAMKEKCPFAVATPVVPVAEPTASFAANWFVSGIARIGDQDFVTIKARDLSTQFSLYGNEPNQEHGVTLASIEWSEAVGKSTVVLRKGNETAKLEFNEAEVHSPPPGTNNPANPVGQPPRGTNAPPMPVGQRFPAANGAVARNGTPQTAPLMPKPPVPISGQPMPLMPAVPPKRPNPVPNSGPPQTQRRVVPIPVQQ